MQSLVPLLIMCSQFCLLVIDIYRDLQAQIGEKVAMFVAGGKFSGNSTNPAPIAEALKAYVDSREKVCLVQ